MQKKAARLCCAILLMAVAIAASMGLMSAVFAAQSLRTPDIQAAEAPTEAPLMLVRVLFCTDGEISEITIQDEGGQELQRLIPGRDGSAVSARLEPGRYRAVTTLGEAVFTLLPNASVRAESGPCWSDGEQLHLTAVPVGSVLVQRSLAAIRALLPPEDYRLLCRITLEGATHLEVAKELGISVWSSQKRLQRIRKKLCKQLLPNKSKNISENMSVLRF